MEVAPEIDGHLGANGLCEYRLKRLTVAGNRSELQQVKTLAHEIGHALRHEPPAEAASGQRIQKASKQMRGFAMWSC